MHRTRVASSTLHIRFQDCGYHFFLLVLCLISSSFSFSFSLSSSEANRFVFVFFLQGDHGVTWNELPRKNIKLFFFLPGGRKLDHRGLQLVLCSRTNLRSCLCPRACARLPGAAPSSCVSNGCILRNSISSTRSSNSSTRACACVCVCVFRV